MQSADEYPGEINDAKIWIQSFEEILHFQRQSVMRHSTSGLETVLKDFRPLDLTPPAAFLKRKWANNGRLVKDKCK